MPNPDQLIDAEKVRAEMEVMINMTTHPAFVAAMKNMKDTPLKLRQEVGKATLTVDALRAQGVEMPLEMRLTTRYFESGVPGILQVNPDGKVTEADKVYGPNDPGYGGCACGGGLSFCGGAGGGT